MYVLATMVYGGLALGIWYDLLRIIRRAIRAGTVATILIDLIFCAGTALLLAWIFYRTNDGVIRLYAVLGTLLGAGLYAVGASPLVMKLARWLGLRWRRLMNTKPMRGLRERLKK